MPETDVNVSPTQEVSEINAEQQQPQFNMDEYVRRNMEQRFGNGAADNNQQQNQDDNNGQQAEVIVPKPVLIPLDSFKEFGYENQDAIIGGLREYQTLKAAPPKVEPIKFENEESEKLFRAWQSGKKDEVYNYLAEQKRLEQYASAEVDEKTADEILKLGMQVKYKDLNLTQAEIDYKFNKQYGIPKEPVQALAETDDDFSERKSAWDAQVNDIKMNKIIDAKLEKPTLTAAKTNLKFPELNNTADDGYIEYQKNLKLGEEIEAEDREAYKIFSPDSIETKANYIDEKNGVKVNFQYKPDAESFKKSVEMASNIDSFFKHFVGQDGKPDRKRFLEAVDVMLNKERYILEAIKQAKTETIIAKLPDNTQGSFNRQAPQTQQGSPLDEQMKKAFALWPGQQASRVS